MADLSIIIVSWNTQALLHACLASIYAEAPLCDFEVWVVDNDSADGSVAMVTAEFPQVNLIASKENLGFAGGNNLALTRCNGRYILLLNPDTLIKPGALQTLVDFLDSHPEAGAAGSMLLNPDETLQSCTYPFPTLGRELWRLFHLDRIRPYGVYHMAEWGTQQSREVEVIQGASLLIRREILDEVGLFDTTYFMYSEEVDLCYRIHKAGWKLFYVPQSRVIHLGGQSTKQVAAEMFLQLYKGKLLYFRKHHGRFAALLYKVILILAAVVRIALSPMALLQRPSTRATSLTLSRHYRLLLSSLPSM